MATKLEIINNIMRRVREPVVTSSTSSAYATLVAAIVADAYEEVLDEWNWRPVATITYIDVPALADRVLVSADTVGYGEVPDARLVTAREDGNTYAFSYQTVIDDTASNMSDLWDENGVLMTELSTIDWTARRLHQGLSTVAGNKLPSTTFMLRPLPDETLEVFFQFPSTNDWTFVLTYYRRPARMDTTVGTDNVDFEIPYRPVQELALMYVLNERGEEIGEPGNLAQGRYIQALAAAKELDIKAAEFSDSYDWRRD